VWGCDGVCEVELFAGGLEGRKDASVVFKAMVVTPGQDQPEWAILLLGFDFREGLKSEEDVLLPFEPVQRDEGGAVRGDGKDVRFGRVERVLVGVKVDSRVYNGGVVGYRWEVSSEDTRRELGVGEDDIRLT